MPRTLARAARALPIVAVVGLAGAPSALAGPPGTWTRLTDPANASLIDTSALARTPDATLHVLWKRKTPADVTKSDVFHTAVTADGIVSGPNLVTEAWGSISQVTLVADPGVGLRALLGGQRTVMTGAPNEWESTLTAPVDGSVWSLSPVDVENTGSVYLGVSDADIGADGAIWTTWAPGLSVYAKRGLTPSPTPLVNLHDGLICCGYEPSLAVDRTAGQVWVAWYTNAGQPANPNLEDEGLLYQGLDPATGAPLGARTKIPLSGTPQATGGELADSLPTGQGVAIAALAGRSKVLVAFGAGYPTATKLRLYDLVARKGSVIAQTPHGAAPVGIAATPDGRAWVFWQDGSGPLLARRSNVGATAWGQTVTVKLPKGAADLWNVRGDAQTGPLDVVAQMTVDPLGIGAFHTQVQPGLTLTVKPLQVSAKTGGTLTFRVLDAGVGVKSATVKALGKTLTTNAAGVAKLVVAKGTPRGLRTATATHDGYVNGRVVFRVAK